MSPTLNRAHSGRLRALVQHAVAALVALVVVMPACAAHGQAPHEVIRDNAAAIGLDAETLDAILDLARDARPGREIALAEVRRIRAELELLLQADTPDMDAVYLAIDALGAAEAELRRYDVTVLVEMRSMLTPAQREALADLWAQSLGGQRGPGGPAGHPRHGPPGR